jgi:hypothetical protein
MRTALILLMLWSAGVHAAASIHPAVDPSGACLRYDVMGASLSGTLFTRIYFGPPGYGERPEADARERPYLLLLDAPICVSSDDQRQGATNQSNLIVVQLAPVHVEASALQTAMGMHVTVRGTLFPAITGHHRTPVLMDVHAVDLRSQ